MLSTQFKVRTATDPFHVVLTKRGTNWDEDVQKGRDEDEMNARLFSIDAVSHKTKEDTYQDKWKDRNPRSKPKPRYTEHGTVPGQGRRPVHMPIIMQEAEFVRFQGAEPFFVMIIRETEVDATGIANPFVGATDPNVPFSEFSRFDNATGLYFVQKQVLIKSDELVNQLFFKMIFVVLDNGEPKLADPDFFCDR